MTKTSVFQQKGKIVKKEKYIEFDSILVSNKTIEGTKTNPMVFENVTLIFKTSKKSGYDFIYAWDNNDPLGGALMLGKWNDGVVEE